MDRGGVREPVTESSATAVSVLMPCFNAESTLDEAVESIVGQTLTDWELIAVDDGSTDSTVEKLGEWAVCDARIRLIEQPHSGIVEALNAGLRLCRFPLIARMDADDRSHPNRLKSQIEYLRQRVDVAAVGCLVGAFPAGDVRDGFLHYLDWLNALTEPDDIARELYIESPLPHPSVMVRAEWFDGYEEHGWPEDYDLWLRLHGRGARFGKVSERLFYWREAPGRLTRVDGRYSVENFLRAKAHYLCEGPLADRDAVFIWGAGQMGRRISKHLARGGAPLAAFIDIAPQKIGRTKRGLPILAPDELPARWAGCKHPALLAAVGSRGARQLIRERLNEMGLVETVDYWAVA